MLRLVLISMISLFATATATAETAGSYSRCKKLGANAGSCESCLRKGQMYNFDTVRKQWVCGDTTGMTRSKPMTATKKPVVTKPGAKPSSVKKR